MSKISKEITPLDNEDLFAIFHHINPKFDYPLHYHTDYELTLTIGVKGKRIVGDSIENMEEMDLILVGTGVPHQIKATTEPNTEQYVIQFANTINSMIGSKRVLNSINELLERSNRGIHFYGPKLEELVNKIISLSKSCGFNTYLDFFSLLHDLSIFPDQEMLSSAAYDTSLFIRESKSRRIEKICHYIEENYASNITLSDAASLVNMTESATSHFFQKRTYRSFTTYLLDVRLSKACKLLSDTILPISEVAMNCGFGNLSNFNRIFKKNKYMTPSQYRNEIQKVVNKF